MRQAENHVICKNCRAEVQDLPFCPYCGSRLGEGTDSPSHEKLHKRARWRGIVRRWILPLLLLCVVVAFGVMGMALKGFKDGTEERLLEMQRQAEIHYNLGLVWMECGQYQMAEAEFEEALRLAPDNAQASEKWQQARLKQTVTPLPTPTTALVPTPTPTSTPPTPEVVVIPTIQVLFEEGLAHYENGEWEEAISRLTEVRRLDSTYQSDLVPEMLFQSHYQYGMELEEQDVIEGAIVQYDRALLIRPRDPDVKARRKLADLYQSALDVWSVDWERALINLTALYALAPDYKDAANRLYEASVTYAETFVDQYRWCNAAELYEQALEVRDDDPEVVKLEEQTKRLCETASALPLETQTPDGMWPPQGEVMLGTLIASCYDYQTDQSSICLQNAVENTLSRWIAQAEQPALTLDGSMLAYRSTDPERPGLYALSVVGSGAVISGSTVISDSGVILGDVITITTEVEAHYPTWSPDGKRVAYALYDVEREDWFIAIADLEGSGPPRLVHQGEWPSWGPGGWLACTTCSQEERCGIHIYDPRSGELRGLTASIQDRAPAWSPSGDEIAYMSDVGGISVNLYVVHVGGYVRQITRNLSADRMPVWSPDGQRIAYVTNHSNGWSVYLVHPYSGHEQRLMAVGAESADWSRFRLSWVAPVIRLAGQP
jgi:tetratricopeptide (TPR) repeat protein